MNNNNQNSGNFLNAFIFGAIVGAAGVFLLGTKRGKKILNAISQEGLELSELFGEDEDLIDEDFKEPHKHCENCKVEENSEKETPPLQTVKTNGNGALTKIKKVHRFFKGIHRKAA
ncbi:MAG: hypothetical protein Q8P10_00930 [bacterium]|nr:hypothetical protein [bacterium]